MKPIKPVIVKKPKRRIPVAPPGVEHKDKKAVLKHMPSGRLAKHKKTVE